MLPTTKPQTALTTIVDTVEAKGLQAPQVECPVVHHFAPGIYVRELHMPAGIIAVGHHHRHAHLNYMLAGVIDLVTDAGIKTFRAPFMLTTGPGRKLAYVHEATVWQNIIPTTLTNVEEIEAEIFDHSEAFTAFTQAEEALRHHHRQLDRDDFTRVTEDVAACFPSATSMKDTELLQVRQSPIHGRGLFSSVGRNQGDVIAAADSALLSALNHSPRPNAMVLRTAAGPMLIALRDIKGCEGGGHGEELTVDYRVAAQQLRS